MATANAMFTITDVGDLNGRNLVLDSHEEHSKTVPSSGANGVVPYYTYSDFASEFTHRKGQILTVSFDYETTGNTLSTGIICAQHNESQIYTTAGAEVKILDNPSGHYSKTFTVTANQSTSTKNTIRIYHKTCSPGTVIKIKNIKVEIGDTATDWTPAPEDVNTALIDAKEAQSTADNARTAASNAQTDATYAKNEIDGLEIGGRNILKHSDQVVIRRYSNSTINTESGVTVDEWSTNSGIRYYGNAGTSIIFGIIGGSVGIAQKTHKYLSRPYAFSVYVKNLSETSRLRFLVNGKTIANAVEIAPLEQKRVTDVYSNPNTASAIQFTLYVDNAGDTFDFVMWHPQIEYGTRVTDWTPAPEDVEEAIDSKNSVYYQSTTPTAHKVGDTWFDIANDYKIRRWNGSTWAAAELGNQAIGNLNASHINSGTLTAVHIEAGKAQDIAGTINVYDEDDAVKVSLDKDGLVATKGKIGNWDISSYSIQYQEDTPSSEDTVIGGDEDEQLIESGTPTLVGGSTLKLKICTYDPNNPNLGPHIISSVVENGVAPQYDNGKTMRISNGGLACYYNRNNGVTGGSVSINPKLINVINADYDEDQILWTDSTNLNPGSLTIMMTKTENEEQTSVGRSFLTYRDLAFIGDPDNPQLASGIAHWSVLSPVRTIKGTLTVTVYHCGNLFWAHFDGTIPAGWTAGNTRHVFIPIITGDTDLSNSALVAPPDNVTKYIIPTDLENMRISVTVRSDGQLGISRIAEPFKGNATATIAGYMETCDIFWAHIG